ncbi:unnamed protein product [Menidia menidia]|uniref:(Atlantic silverside) hypothetical protein n=1 Tax=Menidia menidia TaxID=238744 RepID=A0A8S4BAD7_9TELE|nr:unnamed protein product [Menidia menidia]
MDPTTQSAQISSSQGLTDGQNSASKESKLSDRTDLIPFFPLRLYLSFNLLKASVWFSYAALLLYPS